MSQYNILVVDDDREIVRSLGKLLELEGYRVKKAYNGMEALDILMTEQIHLILLDVMMPKMNGLSALMKIREKNNIPIIMLSAKTEESDKVIGLSMGADDYVTKPYNTAELMARVKSQLRRYFSLGAANGTTQSQDILKNGGLLLNRNTKELLVDGESCPPDRNRVQNHGASDGASRLRILSRRNLQPGLAGGCLQRRKYRHGSYPAHS